MVEPYYRDDAVTIYCGDCRDILPQLQPVDLILTDPPYGVDYAKWDTFLEPKSWMTLTPSKTTLIFCGIAHMFSYPQPRWILSWIKDNSTQRNITGGFAHWEPILFYGEGKWPKDSIRILDCGDASYHSYHPTVKPLSLIKWLIGNTKAVLILDPFMGSGTTLRAAKDLGCKAIGIEIEENYCKVAVTRMSQEVLSFFR